jgi:hypothetical protein
MHLPTTADCRSSERKPRMWANRNPAKPMTPEEIERSSWCWAFSCKEKRLFTQGEVCEGRAKIPEHMR